jgi:adhesin transport system membrane fusion protein
MSEDNEKKAEPWLPREDGATPGQAAAGSAPQVQVRVQSQPQPGAQVQAGVQVQMGPQPSQAGSPSRSPFKPFSGGRGGAAAAAAAAMANEGPPRLFVGTTDEQPLPRVSWIIWIIAIAFAVFLGWASLANLTEVSTGTGKVVPSSKDQEIQSQDGGILRELPVKEGDIVQAGQVIAKLDPVRGQAAVGESSSRMRAGLATAARLSAQVNGTKLVFPQEVQQDQNLVRSETQLYDQSTSALQKTLSDFDSQIKLAQDELKLTEPLVAQGAASEVEVLRLKSRIADLQTRRNSAYNDYYVKGREDLAKANAEVDSQRAITLGREDALSHTTFTSPVRGIVKDISVTTIGGVIPPSGKLMSIVPLDDKLLVEVRISPRDIAFIRPDQDALVKVTAYDYAIYGGLKGKVTVISPDTIQDEVKRDLYYYRVYVRTDSDHLTNKLGKKFPISPGMITTVDIRTGHKTVLDYLIKPLNRAREALRER